MEMKKFTCAFSVPCTEEQYKDIQPILVSFGYTTKYSDHYHKSQCNCLITSSVKEHDLIIFTNSDIINENQKYRLERFDRDLVLTLASMTDGDFNTNDFVVVTKKRHDFKPNIGDILKITTSHSLKEYCFLEDYFQLYNWNRPQDYTSNALDFRKATPLEIIAAFNKKKSPEKWYIKGSDELRRYFKSVNITSLSGDAVNLGYFIKPSGWKNEHVIALKNEGYEEITVEQYKKQFMKEEVKINTYPVTREQLKNIWDIACATWKSQIESITEECLGLFKKEGVLNHSIVKSMFDAANLDQKRVLTSIFPTYTNSLFPNKSLVWCWDKNYLTVRHLRVWNAFENEVFHVDGKTTMKFDNYELYSGDVEEWMQNMINNCKC